MKITFAITVCNELEEIKKLLPFLVENKRMEDEVVILYDEKNGNSEVLNFLLSYNVLPNVQTWRGFGFDGDFGEWKNKLNSYCKGDYIFQIDADEMLSEHLIKNISTILEMNPEVDLIFVPRVNTVDGLTESHIKQWGWRLDENNWVNFPDWQGRIYKNGLNWYGRVHERIVGAKNVSTLPTDYLYCLIHHKDIKRQEKQNNYYNSL